MYKLCNDTQEKSFLPSQYGIRALTSTIKRGFSLCCTGLSKLVFFFSFLSFLLSSLQQIKISLLSTVPKCNHLVYTAYKVSFIHFIKAQGYQDLKCLLQLNISPTVAYNDKSWKFGNVYLDIICFCPWWLSVDDVSSFCFGWLSIDINLFCFYLTWWLNLSLSTDEIDGFSNYYG